MFASHYAKSCTWACYWEKVSSFLVVLWISICSFTLDCLKRRNQRVNPWLLFALFGLFPLPDLCSGHMLCHLTPVVNFALSGEDVFFCPLAWGRTSENKNFRRLLLFDWFFYPRQFLAFGYCHRLRLWVCVSVYVSQSLDCQHNNSALIQAGITKFGQEMQTTLF